MQTLTHFTAVDDHVDMAMLQQELGALETLGQRLSHCLFDHPGSGETDQGGGPAKPIRAPGSAALISPSMARLADTPPVVGWVMIEI